MNQYDSMASAYSFIGQAFVWALILFAFACPICSAIVAGEKGRNVFGWGVIGLAFGPFGLLAAVGVPAIDREAERAQRGKPSRKKLCPACYETMWQEASVCPHCQTVL